MKWPLFILAISFVGSGGLGWFMQRIAWRFGIIDEPDGGRKQHERPVALLGGVAVITGWLITLGLMWWLKPEVLLAHSTVSKLLGLMAVSVWLLVVGVLDDCNNLSPRWQIISVMVAVALALVSGLSITTITNPFGGVVHLDWWWIYKVGVWSIPLLSWILTAVWFGVTMFATKLFDGLDGLVTGVGALGGFALFALSLAPPVLQTGTAWLGLSLFGACLGFLVWNFFPAKIFLGQAGSLWLGFILGALAIIAGGKVATTLLILALPLLDMVVVMGWRAYKLKRSPFLGDRWHLHFRLVDLGWSVSRAVLTVYVIVALFVVAGVFASSFGRLTLLTLLTLLILMIEWLLFTNERL